jgi:hypothetical protein
MPKWILIDLVSLVVYLYIKILSKRLILENTAVKQE